MISQGDAPVCVLMSEGSSLSARESLTALGLAGFHVEVVDANPFCLARFSRFCRKLHRAPRFGVDPEGYLDHVIRLLSEDGFDVLFPAHEQAYLFSRFLDRLSPLTRIALPDFDVFERLQSKVGFAGVLAELGLPLAAVGIALLVKPALWRKFSSSTVKAYAATPRVVEFVHHRSARAASRSAT